MSRVAVTYGVDPRTGELKRCRAKPENRGKGTCTHGEHHELTEDAAVIQRYNEAALASFYGPQEAHTKKTTITGPGGGELNREEFQAATQELAAAFPEADWEFINKFYLEFNEVLEDELKHPRFSHASESIQEYLEGDSAVAERIRSFLGEEVDLKVFSQILVCNVKSMRAAVPMRNNKSRDNIGRIVTTNVNNDMTRERYVASVLFFGGRCCYCNCVLTKTPGPDQASGEHITPLTPSKEGGVCGGTRYGNMALACLACNHERGNKGLEEWLDETNRVSPENKLASMERIKAFRRFALYREYTPEESRKIMAVVSELGTLLRETPSLRKVYSDEDYAMVKDKVYTRIFELQQELRQ